MTSILLYYTISSSANPSAASGGLEGCLQKKNPACAKDPKISPACAHHVATHEGVPVRHGRGRKLIRSAIRLCGCSGLPTERSSLIPALALGTTLCHRTAGPAASGIFGGIPVRHGQGRTLIHGAVNLCGRSGLPAERGSLIPALVLGTALCHRAAGPAASGVLYGVPA